MIRLRTLLVESININGMTLQATNTQSGGPIEASWSGGEATYAVSMDSMLYSGALGITAIYKKDGEYHVATNRNQHEELKLAQLNKLVDRIKSGDAEIEIAGRFGTTITFTKKS